MGEDDDAAAFHAARQAGEADDETEEPDDAADRRARAARIRARSVELIEALGPDHPLVAEALARADALDTGDAGESDTEELDVRAGGAQGDADTIDLRSSPDLAR